MKSREEAIAWMASRDAYTSCMDGRDRMRLASFLPREDWPKIGVEAHADAGDAGEPLPWQATSIIAHMALDVAFGFEKALAKRGISANLMHQVVLMWLYVLEDPLFEQASVGLARDDLYTQYGLPLFKAVAVKYGLPNPIGRDAGNEPKYSAEGEP